MGIGFLCSNITRAEFGALMNPRGKNKRDVWTINADRHQGSHPAVMPEALAEICVRAGSRAGDLVMDPFCGTGTTGVVALKIARKFIGIDLLRQCAEESRYRLREVVLACSG